MLDDMRSTLAISIGDLLAIVAPIAFWTWVIRGRRRDPSPPGKSTLAEAAKALDTPFSPGRFRGSVLRGTRNGADYKVAYQSGGEHGGATGYSISVKMAWRTDDFKLRRFGGLLKNRGRKGELSELSSLSGAQRITVDRIIEEFRRPLSLTHERVSSRISGTPTGGVIAKRVDRSVELLTELRSGSGRPNGPSDDQTWEPPSIIR
jgi:hypothetical protein